MYRVYGRSVQTSQKRQNSRGKRASERRREKKKKELIGIFLNWPQFAHYPSASRSVKMCGVGGFSNACHVCLSLPAKPQKSDWRKCWRRLSNLTNRTVYQTKVLKTMLTGLTSRLSPAPTRSRSLRLESKCARSIWLICYKKTCLESN